MATTEFGDPVDEIQVPQTTEFGDVVVPRGTTPGMGVQGLPLAQRTAEQQQAAQEFIKAEQQPTLTQIIQGAKGLGEALIVNPLKGIGGGIMAIPEVVASPSTVLPTLPEIIKRLSSDVGGIVRTGARQLPSIAAGGPLGFLGEQIRGLAPRTPSEAEVEQFLARQPLDQALSEERAKVAYEGANPALAEAITQVVEIAPPIKGLQAAGRTMLGGINVAKAPVSRILRSAVKPKKQFGPNFEKATDNTISDIFYENMVADNAAIPLEGFTQSVSAVKARVGQQIDQGLKAAGKPIGAGDAIASELNARAAQLERAGQSADLVQAVKDRAVDFTGRVNEMDALREAVTLANRELTPAFQRTKEAANPFLAKVDSIINSVIAKTGGSIENKALDSLVGPEGAVLRKKWSDLSLVEQQSAERLNKIINDAPADIQPLVVTTLTSPQGLLGLVGLIQGYTASGVTAIASSAARAWAKNSQKLLKDSNSLVKSAYERLRTDSTPRQVRSSIPPVIPSAAIPPTVPAVPLNLQQFIQQSIRRPSSPVATPGINPVVSAPVNIEAQIANLIRSYPPTLRRDPTLARLAAQRELGLLP